MPRITIVQADKVRVLDRGSGIKTIPLITHQSAEQPQFTSVISTYPSGQGAPMHSHNCPEQVTLLEGQGEVEVDGVVTPLQRYDSTYIPANYVHAFRNTGPQPMTILWIYAATNVTRTFADSGKTVEHLSAEDLRGSEPDK